MSELSLERIVEDYEDGLVQPISRERWWLLLPMRSIYNEHNMDTVLFGCLLTKASCAEAIRRHHDLQQHGSSESKRNGEDARLRRHVYAGWGDFNITAYNVNHTEDLYKFQLASWLKDSFEPFNTIRIEHIEMHMNPDGAFWDVYEKHDTQGFWQTETVGIETFNAIHAGLIPNAGCLVSEAEVAWKNR